MVSHSLPWLSGSTLVFHHSLLLGKTQVVGDRCHTSARIELKALERLLGRGSLLALGLGSIFVHKNVYNGYQSHKRRIYRVGGVHIVPNYVNLFHKQNMVEVPSRCVVVCLLLGMSQLKRTSERHA